VVLLLQDPVALLLALALQVVQEHLAVQEHLVVQEPQVVQEHLAVQEPQVVQERQLGLELP